MSWDYIADLKHRLKMARSEAERKRLQQFISDGESDPTIMERTRL